MKGKKMIEMIIEQLAEAFKHEFELVGDDFTALEQVVKAKMQLLGKGLLQRMLDSRRHGYQGSSIACKCGGSMKFVNHRSRDIHTLFGWVKIRRAYYHCSGCGRSFTPYDRASGLGAESASPGLARACCLLSVDDSFELTSCKIEQLLDQSVSDDTARQLVHHVGSLAAERLLEQYQHFKRNRQIPAAEITPQRLYVTADGTNVCEDTGFHEAKVGCIYGEDENFQRKTVYLANFENSEQFGWQLWLEACRCGLREAKEVVYIGDGAGWIRTEHQKHFRKATFIIDWFHVSEHVWDCGKALFGEGSRQTKQWVAKRLDWLWAGRTRKLINELKRQRKCRRGRKRKALNDLIGYISKNEQGMRYDQFRAKGYDVGSGAVEAACKYVVGKRLKQSGMRWNRAGSSATLALRVVWLNGRWDDFWATKPLAA